MAKLAILIPVLNARNYLAQTLESIAAQKEVEWRGYIVDNGSTDESLEIAREICSKDSRFQLFEEKQRGINQALNCAFKALQDEELITFCDHDDLYCPERNKALIKFVEQNRLDIAACNALFIDEEGKQIGQNISYESIGPENIKLAFYLRNLVPSMSQIIARRQFLEEIGPFPEEFSWTLDYFLMVTALIQKKRVGLLNDYLILKRYHRSNYGTNPLNVTASRLKLGWQLYKNCMVEKIDFCKALQIQNRRYINDVQLLRRNGQEDQIPGFLEELGRHQMISSCFYDYFNLIALSRIAPDKAVEFSKQKKINHPLTLYALAFLNFTLKDYQSSADLFRKSWEISQNKFPEALNGAAVSMAFFNPEKSKRLIENCLFCFPDFCDAQINLQLIAEGKIDRLRLNGYVSPRSLDYFLYHYE